MSGELKGGDYLESRHCTLERNPQNIYRVPQCMSPRRHWDSPTPSLGSECAPPPEPGGEAHSPSGEVTGASQFRRLEKKLTTLPTLLGKGSVLTINILLYS
jgi:hypothetical protein